MVCFTSWSVSQAILSDELETRYYMHFVLICTVVVLYRFVVCVCACVCMRFCNVRVCEGFVMCGCFW